MLEPTWSFDTTKIRRAVMPAPAPAEPVPPLLVRLRRAYGSCGLSREHPLEQLAPRRELTARSCDLRRLARQLHECCGNRARVLRQAEQLTRDDARKSRRGQALEREPHQIVVGRCAPPRAHLRRRDAADTVTQPRL